MSARLLSAPLTTKEIYLAQVRLEGLRAGKSKTYPLEERELSRYSCNQVGSANKQIKSLPAVHKKNIKATVLLVAVDVNTV
jgi:hypothetical protein